MEEEEEGAGERGRMQIVYRGGTEKAALSGKSQPIPPMLTSGGAPYPDGGWVHITVVTDGGAWIDYFWGSQLVCLLLGYEVLPYKNWGTAV